MELVHAQYNLSNGATKAADNHPNYAQLVVYHGPTDP